MPRVKTGVPTHARHKNVLKKAKGYYGGRSKLYRTAKEAVDKGLLYSYRGRKEKKRDFRSLWIARINAGARMHGLSYSRMIHGLTLAGIEVNRRMLADLAIQDGEAFAKLAELAKEQL
jgi:large subunit ribosomal protein L20